MSFFSKLFGFSKARTETVVVADDATAREVIALAVGAVVQETGGNCATLELETEPSRWVQLMDSTINACYPHSESPEKLFPELSKAPLVAGLEQYEAKKFMTVSLTTMSQIEVAGWIEAYFSTVLSVNLQTTRLSLRMEDM